MTHGSEEGDKDKSPKLGTIHLVQRLQEQHPNAAFSLILGGDTYADLRGGRWNSGEELQEMVTLDVINRIGFPSITDLTPTTTLHTIPEITDASSTAARACTDAHALETLVGPLVAAYIIESRLFGFEEHQDSKRVTQDGLVEKTN
jgi:nicotinic acid mononucleotide adenylyltransferase